MRIGHGTTDWFQIGKGVCQGYILSPCLFNIYAEYIMRNTGLDEAQAGIKIAQRKINNVRYVDDTTVMAESEEELKSLLRVKEESENIALKLNIHPLDAWGWCTETTQRDGTGREEGGGSGWGTRVHLWRIHVDVWQIQYNIVK